MGVINVTPDSFSDGGARLRPDVAIADAVRLVEAGADLIDVGGESTRPGAAPVPAAEEWRRVGPVLEGLRGRVDVPVSIDTCKAEVAARALDLGADVVNDVTALEGDPALGALVASRGAALVLMHHRGASARMYERAQYADVVEEVARELAERETAARAAGVPADRILLDPGIGFAKRPEQSMAVIAGLPRLSALGRPILCGPSRKSYLTAALGNVPPAEREWGTAAAVTACVLFGAHIVRVHDVASMVQVVRVADAIRGCV